MATFGSLSDRLTAALAPTRSTASPQPGSTSAMAPARVTRASAAATGTGAGAVALDRLARLGWTGPATWISIETARDEAVEVAGFTADATRIHGRARLTLLRAS